MEIGEIEIRIANPKVLASTQRPLHLGVQLMLMFGMVDLQVMA